MAGSSDLSAAEHSAAELASRQRPSPAAASSGAPEASEKSARDGDALGDGSPGLAWNLQLLVRTLPEP